MTGVQTCALPICVECGRCCTLHWPRSRFRSEQCQTWFLGFCEFILLTDSSCCWWYIYFCRIVTNGCLANAHARFSMFPNGREIYRIILEYRQVTISLLTFGICSRNQHIIKTSIPTSHAYISPVDRKTPNFAEQFECMSDFIWYSDTLILDHLGNGTIDWAPFLTVADC